MRSTNNNVTARIRAEIAARRVSRSELARRTGMSATAMHRRLSGEVSMSLDEIDEIAEALEVPAEQLLSAS